MCKYHFSDVSDCTVVYADSHEEAYAIAATRLDVATMTLDWFY